MEKIKQVLFKKTQKKSFNPNKQIPDNRFLRTENKLIGTSCCLSDLWIGRLFILKHIFFAKLFEHILLLKGSCYPDKKGQAFRNLAQVPKVWSVFIRAGFLVHIPQVCPFFILLEFCARVTTVQSCQQ